MNKLDFSWEDREYPDFNPVLPFICVYIQSWDGIEFPYYIVNKETGKTNELRYTTYNKSA